MALVLGGCTGTGGPPPEPTQPPDLVLVVVDTLRADHLGAYGYPRPTSPALDALAAQGTTFERAYAQSGWTLPSMASLLSGQYPHQHRVVRHPLEPRLFGVLPRSTPTLASSLGAQGYRTAAVTSNSFLDPQFGLDQGFDLYDHRGATNDAHRPAGDSVTTALAWLQASEQPALLLLHLMEPHLDYDPPPSTRGRFWKEAVPEAFVSTDGVVQGLRPPPEPMEATARTERAYAMARYDEEILATDQALAELLEGLQARSRRALLVFTADHGEEFWEHGGVEHGHRLMGELTRVPLVVAGPGVPAGRRVSTVVEHVDLFQGLLAAGGAPSPPGSHGEDLLAIARDRPNEAGRSAMSENCLYGPPRISLVTDSLRLEVDQYTDQRSLWSVAADASELVVASDPQGLRTAKLLRRLSDRRGDLRTLSTVAGATEPDPGTAEELESLGYLDEGATTAPKAEDDGAVDP